MPGSRVVRGANDGRDVSARVLSNCGANTGLQILGWASQTVNRLYKLPDKRSARWDVSEEDGHSFTIGRDDVMMSLKPSSHWTEQGLVTPIWRATGLLGSSGQTVTTRKDPQEDECHVPNRIHVVTITALVYHRHPARSGGPWFECGPETPDILASCQLLPANFAATMADRSPVSTRPALVHPTVACYQHTDHAAADDAVQSGRRWSPHSPMTKPNHSPILSAYALSL